MKLVKLAQSDPEPVLLNYYKHQLEVNESEAVLLVGGDDDDRSVFRNIVSILQNGGVKSDFVTISFRGVESQHMRPLRQQIVDLEEVLSYLVKKRNKSEITIVCTSAGAVSTTYLVTSKKFSKSITKVIYLDPADYYIQDLNKSKYRTWTGSDKYQPNRKTVISLLEKINSEVKIHVVNFLLRNHGQKGYASRKDRGKDNPKLFARLNNKMVESFYSHIPQKNKGEYVEDRQLPHAFVRDGDIRKNEKRVADLIYKLLTK